MKGKYTLQKANFGKIHLKRSVILFTLFLNRNCNEFVFLNPLTEKVLGKLVIYETQGLFFKIRFVYFPSRYTSACLWWSLNI